MRWIVFAAILPATPHVAPIRIRNVRTRAASKTNLPESEALASVE